MVHKSWAPTDYARHTWLLVVPILLVLAFVAIRGLSHRTLTFDEYFSLHDAGLGQFGPLSLSEIWQRSSLDLPQVPGYSFALAFWSSVVGWSGFALRFLSVLAGLLTVAWSYRMGRDLVSPLAGVTAALTLGLSVYFDHFLKELRVYTLYTLFTVIAVWAYWRIISHSTKWHTHVLFFVGIFGMFYSHYFALTTILAIAIYHLLFVVKDRRWWAPVLLTAAAFLLYLPHLGATIQIISQTAGQPQSRLAIAVDTKTLPQMVVFLFSNGSVALFALLALPSLITGKAISRFVWLWLLVVIVVAIVGNIALGAVTSIRYLFAIWPALALIVGIGLNRLPSNRLLSISVLGIWAATGLWNNFDPAYTQLYDQAWTRLPLDVMASTLAPHVQPTDQVVFLLPDQADQPMHQLSLNYYVFGLPGHYYVLESAVHAGAASFTAQSDQLLGEARRLWVADDPALPTDRGALDRELIKFYMLCETVLNSENLALRVYAPLANEHKVTLQFGVSDQARVRPITLYSLLPLPDSVSGALPVMLESSITEGMPVNIYSIGLHVLDSKGQLKSQVDYGLGTAPLGCRSSEIDLRGLPPGRYTLDLTVYRWQTGERLTGISSLDSTVRDQVTLGNFNIR